MVETTRREGIGELNQVPAGKQVSIGTETAITFVAKAGGLDVQASNGINHSLVLVSADGTELVPPRPTVEDLLLEGGTDPNAIPEFVRALRVGFRQGRKIPDDVLEEQIITFLEFKRAEKKEPPQK